MQRQRNVGEQYYVERQVYPFINGNGEEGKRISGLKFNILLRFIKSAQVSGIGFVSASSDPSDKVGT